MQRLAGKEMFAGERISLREKPDTARRLTYFSLLHFAEPRFWSPDVCLSPKLSQPFTAEVAAQKHLTNQITDAVGKQHRMHKWPDFIFLRQVETFLGLKKRLWLSLTWRVFLLRMDPFNLCFITSHLLYLFLYSLKFPCSNTLASWCLTFCLTVWLCFLPILFPPFFFFFFFL